VLDFGCGSGRLVQCLLSLGYNAYGCDITPYWRETSHADVERLATLSFAPYRLPFEDNTFDVVVSTSVLEHAQNKEELFSEIYRILKVGGYAMHLFPGKWYLPVEPHIYVPLVNFFWPKCPKWWLALWAFLGVRNEFQCDKSWKEVIKLNSEYCMHGLSYWSNRKYRKLSLKIFKNYSAPMDFYVKNGYGSFAKLLRRVPFQRLSGWIAGEIRMNFIVSRKLKEVSGVI
jgi:SAM-dependent methyltransferase